MITMPVCFKDVDFEVEFEYEPESNGSFDFPGTAEYINIHSIMWKNIDVTNVFSEESLSELEKDLLELREILNREDY